MMREKTVSSNIVLASSSPRRRELLTQLGYSFTSLSPDIEERQEVGESPQQYVTRLSQQKAQEGHRMAGKPCIVIGSDTVVVQDKQALEKPANLEQSKAMLQSLSGRQHQVLTAVTVTSGIKQASVVVTTEVWFKTLSDQEIEQYWLSGEPKDKAGSYGIQGLGGRFVTRIEGSYYAVVGLPLYETDQLLQQFINN
ncbi:Maf family protein [Vibrio hippocampi]|nr:Maf family protein [Vibrio hippocampi]